MFRYRCPQCAHLLQAPEIRAGKSTVCSKCSQPLTIPADKTRWLNEKGEPLLTSPTMVIRPEPATPPPARPEFDDEDILRAEPPETDDVLGAIFLNTITPPTGMISIPSGTADPPPGPGDSVDFSVPELSPTSEVRHAKPVLEPEPAPPAPDPVPVPAAERKPAAPPGPAFSRSLPVPENPPAAPKTTPILPAGGAPRSPNQAVPPAPPRTYPRRTAPVTPPPAHEPATVASQSAAAVMTPPPPRSFVPTPPPRRTGAGSDLGWAAGRGGPRSQRIVTTTPAADDGSVLLDEPLRLRTGADIAADLTAVLATRMKPPPKPPRDLRPTTALWILTTGAALALLVATLVTGEDFAAAVLWIGAAEVLIGYVWVTRIAFAREWQRGVVCAVPPLTVWYLGQWKYARFRPLRFVATGVALMALGWGSTHARPHTRAWVGASETTAPAEVVPEVTARPKLDQLKYYNEQRQYDALIALLRTLARTDPQYSGDAKDRVEIAAELRRMVTAHPDSGVRVEALTAYAAWGGADARDLCLTALESANREERLAALRLLPRWKDESVARRIAERIGRADTETTAAHDALVALGGPHAERAAIARLTRSAEQGVRLTAIEVLGNDAVGGADALAALREVARTSPDPGTRQAAGTKADQIAARLKK